MIPITEWRPADGLTLEPNAERAVRETYTSLALTAGPGAGKTEMLAQRADFLLRTGICPYPYRVLAISFKVDASRNLKDRVRIRCGGKLSSRFDSYTFHAFAKRIIDTFRPELTGYDELYPDYIIGEERIQYTQITFSDLIPLALEIVQKSPRAKNAIQQSYTDVFLDEFQDCTKEQFSLVKALFQNTSIRLTAVGDTKQKIMGWAGALEGIFTAFATDFNATPLNLYQNFRAAPRLRFMQNKIVRVLDPAAAMPDQSLSGSDGTIEILSFDDECLEAAKLAELIANWINEDHIPPREVAVLVSKLSCEYTQQLQKELRLSGVPFRDEQSLQDLAVEPIVKILIDYLLVITESHNSDAYIRLITFLADTSATEEEIALSHNSWDRFLSLEQSTFVFGENTLASVVKTIKRFCDKITLENLISLSSEYENVKRLRQIISDFLKQLKALFQEHQSLSVVLRVLTNDNAIRIMTIHKSKGLEFEKVIILAVEEESFWGKRLDELCVFFVGCSRAKKHLILTNASTRQRPEGYSKRWSTSRSPQMEFLSYAQDCGSD